MKEVGIVKWFDAKKGYGFIARNGKDDLFVHYRAIRTDGFKTLNEGQKVSFDVVKGQKGWQVDNLEIVQNG